MDYKERLLYELLDLTAKIVRLDEYLLKIEKPDKLLDSQSSSMHEYQRCLIERVIKEMGCKIDNSNIED